MPVELAEKVSDERSFDCHMGMKAEEQPHAMTPWGDNQGGNGGNLLVRPSALQENRRLSAGRPRAAHQGGHQEAAFIHKHPIGIQETGFFLIRTQSTLTHVRMRFSSRSTARRSGFWGDHPKECIKREM
jgi:hypothetical protein